MDWLHLLVIVLRSIVRFWWTLWPFSLITRRFLRLRPNNRAVFITGCDTGFGNLAAKRFDAMGMRVFAGCFTDEGARKLKSETSANLTCVPLDVTKSASIAAAAEIVRKASPEGIWGLINNAGIVDSSPADCAIMENYRRVMDVNLFGMVEMTSALMPLLKQQRGRVVNIASVAGFFAPPCFGPYSSSKFAVEAYSDVLRRELLPFEMDCVCIEPSFMATPLIDQERTVQMQQRAWNKLPESYQQEYGSDWVKNQRDEMLQIFKTAANPDLVVDVLEDSLLNRFVPLRFTAGRGVLILKFLATFSQFADALTAIHMELNLPRTVKESRGRTPLSLSSSSASFSSSGGGGGRTPRAKLPVASAVPAADTGDAAATPSAEEGKQSGGGAKKSQSKKKNK